MPVALPKTFQKYILVQSLQQNERYALGVYKHDKQQVVIKFSKKSNALATKWLRTEIACLKVLNKVEKRVQARRKDDTSTILVRVPTLLHVIETYEVLAVVFEYLPATQSFDALSTKEQTDLCMETLKQLRFYSTQLTKSERAAVPNRSGLSMFLLFPVVWLLAVRAYPKKIGLLLHAAWQFILLSPSLIQAKAVVLAHRDVQGHNFILSNSKAHLIDFGFAAYAPEGYDLLCTIILHWEHVELRTMLLNQLSLISLNKPSSGVQYQAIALYSTLTLLSGTDIPIKKAQQYELAMRYWVDTSNFKLAV